jgi:hypothetical protein
MGLGFFGCMFTLSVLCLETLLFGCGFAYTGCGCLLIFCSDCLLLICLFTVVALYWLGTVTAGFLTGSGIFC